MGGDLDSPIRQAAGGGISLPSPWTPSPPAAGVPARCRFEVIVIPPGPPLLRWCGWVAGLGVWCGWWVVGFVVLCGVVVGVGCCVLWILCVLRVLTVGVSPWWVGRGRLWGFLLGRDGYSRWPGQVPRVADGVVVSNGYTGSANTLGPGGSRQGRAALVFPGAALNLRMVVCGLGGVRGIRGVRVLWSVVGVGAAAYSGGGAGFSYPVYPMGPSSPAVRRWVGGEILVVEGTG